MRADLEARGNKTIRGLGRSFKIMDMEGDRKLDKQELYWGLKDLGCTISKREAQICLETLDTNQDGFVDFNEFLRGIRGEPNEVRKEVIDRAFAKFDSDGSGFVSGADLQTVYSADAHPGVQAGEMTTEEVFTEFLASFGDKNGDGNITHAEWHDYYAAVSASVDLDEYFVQMMVTSWQL